MLVLLKVEIYATERNSFVEARKHDRKTNDRSLSNEIQFTYIVGGIYMSRCYSFQLDN